MHAVSTSFMGKTFPQERIFEAHDIIEASIVKGLLEQFGFDVEMRGYALQGAIGELPVTGLVTLWIKREDAERARQILKEHHFL
ncbi:TPA: DUF2007 domain-containing protein [Candidatus Micrarchaeota archaeon]|nr:DUF2007 domain-containing protein [Candidatus Micrarchaeota archaeon]